MANDDVTQGAVLLAEYEHLEHEQRCRIHDDRAQCGTRKTDNLSGEVHNGMA